MKNLTNTVQLIGRLGNDPKIKTFDSGKSMATFSLATNETYTNNKGEKVDDTQWHNVVVWGNKVKVVEQYLLKGKQVAVSGKLVNRSYENKEGEKRYITEVQLNELLMLGSNG